jgi:hypothetical protein
MGNGNGVSRGDRNRNARPVRLPKLAGSCRSRCGHERVTAAQRFSIVETAL